MSQRDEELDEEIRSHLEMAARDQQREGKSPEVAALAARRAFGNLGQVKEMTREVWQWASLERAVNDLRITVRSILRVPGVALTTVAVLGLGIGMAAAMYTVFDSVLVQPLPVTDADRIVLARTLDGNGTDVPLEPAQLTKFARETRTMSAVAGEAHQGAFASTLLDGEEPFVLRAAWVTGNFFQVLGSRPALGRLFTTDDEACMCLPDMAQATAMVLSYDTWQRRFGADSAVLGRKFTHPWTRVVNTIVGVAEPGLAYPVGVEYWMPQVYAGGMNAIGRVAPGLTPAQVREEFLPLVDRIYKEQSYPRPIVTATAQTLPDAVTGPVRPVIKLLGAAVVLLLLIACINVGTLLLLRVTGRAQEIAIRRSLGAGNAAIARHLILETTLLVTAAGVIGIALSWATLKAVGSLAIIELPRMDVVRAAGTPVAAALAGTLVALVLTGLVPVLAAMRHDPAAPRAGTRVVSLDRPQVSARQWLVGSQVALAVVMLAAAGLLVRSLDKLVRVDLGYRAERLSFVQVAIPLTVQTADSLKSRLLRALPPAIRAVKGVSAATPGILMPFYGPGVYTGFWEVEGRLMGSTGRNPMVPVEAGDASYFTTMDIPILKGRGFLASDNEASPKVAVLSERTAKMLFPDEDPIGKRVRGAGDTTSNAWSTVVGIAGDIRYRVLRETTPTIYLPSSQYYFQGLMILRSGPPLSQLMPSIREAVRAAYPDARIADARTMDDLLATQRAVPRLSSTLISALGATALLLAAIGLYGVMNALVLERTREMAVRMAFGATRREVAQLVIGNGLRLVLLGIGLGLLGAVAATRLIHGLLYGVSRLDPLSFGLAAVVLFAAAGLACVVPTLRATSVDPVIALRGE